MNIGVFKFTSCGGCQYSLLDLGESLLKFKISYFTELSSKNIFSPLDLALIEGSVTTNEEENFLKKIRKNARYLVALGACAVSGGIQAIQEDKSSNRIRPYSKPLADFVPVEFELRGCPISKHHLLEVLFSLSVGSMPLLPDYPLCLDCKRKGNPCLIVTKGVLCLGVITQGGCGAICPSKGRGCYGCFGPVKKVNLKAFFKCCLRLGLSEEEAIQALKNSFNGYHPDLRELYENIS
ncbi:MAG: hypothetical protein N2327_06375 [Caldimicrobium sp.]|nr:hypothetical protein [Caldimicrobium sp.]MCX7874038.1 hypothetical protein [Caldimicrobium sp.]MDW8093862.1 hypothetical protein [Caldimicrobium sp.]